MSQPVLLIIDMVNTFDFEGGARLARAAAEAARRIATLRRRWHGAGAPVVYVNDNFMRWQADFRELVAVCMHDGMPGAGIARQLQPGPDDYFVLKPKHSGFFGTTLETLLRFIGARTLVLTGLTTEMCVLFTAMDAYMRDYALLVPGDCCAAASAARHWQALDYPQQVLKADTRPAAELPLERR